MQEQVGNTSREMKTLRIKTESTIAEIKIAFDGFINRLDIAKKRISELEDMLIETSQTT